ncbi:MAG: class I SAM-dependent methyltransferase, partial [Bdellovibrionales bacterium]|nr:class I SAM-dependent methyltransferase [Bdellovibrionales bacterium]
MEYLKTNKNFWNRYSQERGPWSRRSSKELIEKARQGEVEIFITTQKIVPQAWLPDSWQGIKVLGLAAGGGQQMPIVAAAGAEVTSFDLSVEQLQRDQEVCEEEGLSIKTVQGDMRDLSCFSDSQFDLIINPVSNCFIDDVTLVWKECFRVLTPGGVLISGSNNPVAYALDQAAYERG